MRQSAACIDAIQQVLKNLLLLTFFATALSLQSVQAGTLTKTELETMFAAPLLVGEKEAKLPVWPIFKKEAAH
jgi:NosR/NirI family transcriptional regulator, nitrous oxide reductase regulator